VIGLVGPGDGEALRAGPIRLRVLESGERTGHRLGMVEITLGPNTPGPPQHIHREHDETFYVIAGTPTFTSATHEYPAPVGSLVVAGAGTPHTFANAGAETAVILCTLTPDLYLDYFRELDRLPNDAPLNPAVLGEIMARYATEIHHP
jgi:quercetin dioxygenase-like cupin family protein